MTTSQVIAAAQSHAARGDVETACRIIRERAANARRSSDQWALDIAKARILDAAVDATVARSQRAA